MRKTSLGKENLGGEKKTHTRKHTEEKSEEKKRRIYSCFQLCSTADTAKAAGTHNRSDTRVTPQTLLGAPPNCTK